MEEMRCDCWAHCRPLNKKLEALKLQISEKDKLIEDFKKATSQWEADYKKLMDEVIDLEKKRVVADRLLHEIRMVAHGEGLSDTTRVIRIQVILHEPEKRVDPTLDCGCLHPGEHAANCPIFKRISEQCWCAAKAEAKDAVCPIHE